MATATGALTPSATMAPSTSTDSGDAGLDERHRDAREAERAARRHRQHEARRHQPQRPAAQLVGEQTDRDHRQDVIEPAERMREAVHETMRVTAAGMREGCSRKRVAAMTMAARAIRVRMMGPVGG